MIICDSDHTTTININDHNGNEMIHTMLEEFTYYITISTLGEINIHS